MAGGPEHGEAGEASMANTLRGSSIPASPSSGPLVVLVRNEWGEEHVAVGLFDSNEDAVEWTTESASQPGNRGYTYGVMPLIQPAEYVDGEWKSR